MGRLAGPIAAATNTPPPSAPLCKKVKFVDEKRDKEKQEERTLLGPPLLRRKKNKGGTTFWATYPRRGQLRGNLHKPLIPIEVRKCLERWQLDLFFVPSEMIPETGMKRYIDILFIYSRRNRCTAC